MGPIVLSILEGRLIASLERVRDYVFVFVQSSRPRFHGHDHEDSACSKMFEQPAMRVLQQRILGMDEGGMKDEI